MPVDLDKAVRVEKAYLKKMKKDTYKERRKEGRTKHGQTSIASIIIGTLALLLQIAALASPTWRVNFVGVLLYPHARKWGIFAVSGAKSQYYHDYKTATCGFYGQLNVGGLCSSPICLWYKDKCMIATEFMYMSYACGLAFSVELIIHTLCLVWTFMMAPKTLRWAATWYPVCVFIHVCSMVAWVMLSENEFDKLSARSFYPTPGIGLGVIMSAVAGGGVLLCAFFSCLLRAMWPEVEIEEGEEVTSASSDDDEKYRYQPKASAPGQEGQMPPPGYDPAGPQGMGYDPAGAQGMGYDPAGPTGMGYDPAGPPPTGYDPTGLPPVGYDPAGYGPAGMPPPGPGMGPGMGSDMGPPPTGYGGLEPAWGPPMPLAPDGSLGPGQATAEFGLPPRQA